MNNIIICVKIFSKAEGVDKLHNSTNINLNIANIVCAKQANLQETVHHNWWYGKTKTSLFIKLVREICFYFTLALNFIIISGYFMDYERYKNVQNAAGDRAAIVNAIITFSLGTLFLVLGYIFQKLSKNGYFGIPTGKALTSFLLTTIGAVQLMVTAIGVLVTNQLSNMYATSVVETTSGTIWFKLIGLHLLPLLLLIVSSVLFYVGAKLNKKEKTEIYAKLTDRLYKEFVLNPELGKSQSDWEKYLDNYTAE